MPPDSSISPQKREIFSMPGMKFQQKHRNLFTGFVFAVVFASFTAAHAFATTVQIDTRVFNEMLGKNNLKSENTLGEARNSGHLLRAWEADDSTRNVWMALDGGAAFQVAPGTTRTSVSPVVATLGKFFLVFHRGDDGGIYYTSIDSTDANNRLPNWIGITSVLGGGADGDIAAVELGPGAGRVLVVYHTGGDLVYTVGSNPAGWSSVRSIAGGTGLSSPSIAWDPVIGKVVAVVQGEDSRVWKSTYNPNNDSWDFWTSEGEPTGGRPTIAINNAGTMMIAVPIGGRLYSWAAFDSSFNQISDWNSLDGPVVRTEAQLVSDGTNFFLTYNQDDHICQYQGFNFH
jgi:hypothetical protein